MHIKETEIEKEDSKFVQPQGGKIDGRDDKEPLEWFLATREQMPSFWYLVIESKVIRWKVGGVPTKAIIRS